VAWETKREILTHAERTETKHGDGEGQHQGFEVDLSACTQESEVVRWGMGERDAVEGVKVAAEAVGAGG
jgi:hypothetical protein